MITKEMIDRINFLSRKSKTEELTAQEKHEQQLLRKQYIDNIKGQVKQQLDCIEFVDEKKAAPVHIHSHKHHHKCGCDCDCKKH